jgi:lysophospholipase L1-like esterase
MKLSKLLGSAASFAASLLFTTTALHAVSASSWKFDFGSGTAQTGYTRVLPTTGYSSSLGYGFVNTELTSVDRGAPDALRGDYITSTRPFTFYANVPPGNYNITVITGDNAGTSNTSIKSEGQRIITQQLATTSGQFSTYTATVRVKGDGVLDLTFYGSAPKICSLDIAQTTTAITMFIAGDSTVTDQTDTVYAGWGQMYTSFLRQGVAVGNYADSGESSTSFWSPFYVPNIQPALKVGDYLFIQFGHNDEKALTLSQYYDGLKRYVDDAKSKGAKPILVTPVERNVWSGGALTWSHGSYPDTMKQLATDTGTPCIDLTTSSHNLGASMGQTTATTYFYPGDKTHTNQAGAMKVAALVRDGVRALNLSPLVTYTLTTTPPSPPQPPAGLPAAGNYSLFSRQTTFVIDDLGATTDGADVGVYADGTSANQRWTLSYISSTVVKLQCAGNGKFLDGMGRTTAGSNLGQYAGSTSNNQRWTILDRSLGYYSLKNVATGLVVDINGTAANGMIVKQGTESSTNWWQMWMFAAP